MWSVFHCHRRREREKGKAGGGELLSPSWSGFTGDNTSLAFVSLNPFLFFLF